MSGVVLGVRFRGECVGLVLVEEERHQKNDDGADKKEAQETHWMTGRRSDKQGLLIVALYRLFTVMLVCILFFASVR